ncbi:hypothetical protein BUM88_04330 [Acinetobacter calcoaceticus]|jgi:hypothetical protein|uniref:hypothetical protein n=1 Tax=Acinetobacter calcoaceticus TaxID=471 RepID=UPI0009AF0BA4|nr:hypothetical protein [Acinetobacter calcoaceticus]AQZ80897.1 hypothetical protein BUM88_04330 [Acinetobacter calcoaceticus]
MTTDILNIYRDILLSLRDREDTHDKFVGWLTLDPEIAEKLKLLSREGLADSSLRTKKNFILIGSTTNLESINPRHYLSEYLFEIKLEKNNINNGDEFIICYNWDELLSYPHYIINPIYNLFLTSKYLLLNSDSNDNYYMNYLKVSKVYEFINFLSVNTKSDSGTIFFNRSYKFNFILKENDLKESLDIQTLDTLMNKDMHREAIIHLMCKEVTVFIKDIDEKDRFSHIINHLNPLITNILHSYQSFVDDYSFDKVRKEYNEKKTEYTKKINDTFDSIATKMLAIPAGIWFATAQIKNNAELTFDFTRNFVVLMTVLCMVIVLILNILGQYSTLKELQNEYSSVFKNLKTKFADETTEISDIEKDLDKKKGQTIGKMTASIIISIALFIYTLVLFLYSL